MNYLYVGLTFTMWCLFVCVLTTLVVTEGFMMTIEWQIGIQERGTVHSTIQAHAWKGRVRPLKQHTNFLFYAFCFAPSCFNAPCHFTTFLHLCSLIFALHPLAGYVLLRQSLISDGNIIFSDTILLMTIFSGTQLGLKIRVGCQ